MALKETANEDLTMGFTGGASGSISRVTAGSAKAKAGGKGIMLDTFTFSISGAIKGDCTQAGPYQNTMPATAQKVNETAQGKAVCRKDDEKSVSIPGTDGDGDPCTINDTVKITDAGQTKVKAE